MTSHSRPMRESNDQIASRMRGLSDDELVRQMRTLERIENVFLAELYEIRRERGYACEEQIRRQERKKNNG